MPTISMFYGIVVLMFWDDHNPPHFHARYADSEAIVSIGELQVLVGGLPLRAERLLLEWAAQHQGELMENWELCKSLRRPNAIAPLQ